MTRTLRGERSTYKTCSGGFGSKLNDPAGKERRGHWMDEADPNLVVKNLERVNTLARGAAQ
jgi:hypothetical protein